MDWEAFVSKNTSPCDDVLCDDSIHDDGLRGLCDEFGMWVTL